MMSPGPGAQETPLMPAFPLRALVLLTLSFVSALALAPGNAGAMPTISVTSPANATITNVSIVVFEAHVNPPNASVILNGNPVSPNASGNISELLWLSEGLNALAITARDWLNETASVTVFVLLDTVPPSLATTSPSNGTLTNRTSIDLSGTTDGDANVTVNGFPAVVDPANGTFSITGVRLEALFDQTENILTVRAVDPAGNVAFANLTVIVDVQAPAIVLEFDPEMAARIEARMPISATSILVRGTTDSVGANITVGNISVPLSGLAFSIVVALTEGLNNISIRVQDAAGNLFEVTLAVIRDTLAPSLNLTSPSSLDFLTNQTALPIGGFVDGGDVVVYILYTDVRGLPQADPVPASLNASSSRWEFGYTLLLNADGNPHAVTVRARDVAGNTDERLFQYTVDVVRPALSVDPLVVFGISPPQVWVNGSTEENITSVTINEEVAAVTAGAFSVRFDLAPSEGDTFFVIVATDAAGNSASQTLTAHFALPPPPLPAELHLSVNGAPPAQAAAGVPVSLTLDLQNASRFTLSWYADGVPIALGGSPNFTFSEGSHTLLVHVSNGASSQNYTFRVVARAPAPPPPPLPASLTLYANGTPIGNLVAGSPVRLAVNLTNAAAYNVTWLVDGQTAGTGPSIELALAAGTHTVVANVSNGQTTRTYSFSVVAQAPIAGPSGGSSLLLPVAVAGIVAACAAAYGLRRRARARP